MHKKDSLDGIFFMILFKSLFTPVHLLPEQLH